VTEKEAIGQVATVYLAGERAAAVNVWRGGGGLDKQLAVGTLLDAGVIERIQVYGQATGMGRELIGSEDGTVAETTGIVGSHLPLIVGVEIVSKPDALDGITRFIELAEDVEEIGGYTFVADHLALADVAFKIVVQELQITEIRAGDVGIGLIAASLHPSPDGIGNEYGQESAVRG
jgi:hypothetical protein